MVYPTENLFKEIAFIAYHFHWGREDVIKLSHLERWQWCYEISSINKELSGEQKNMFEDFI